MRPAAWLLRFQGKHCPEKTEDSFKGVFSMQPATHSSIQAMREAHASQQFTPLELEHRPTVGTAAAAHYLDRRPQTLRAWSCLENGPLRPIRIYGRLHWSTEEIRRLLAEGAK
jgi:ferric-dicitrate binding protein FerR (iron transport regulator)